MVFVPDALDKPPGTCYTACMKSKAAERQQELDLQAARTLDRRIIIELIDAEYDHRAYQYLRNSQYFVLSNPFFRKQCAECFEPMQRVESLQIGLSRMASVLLGRGIDADAVYICPVKSCQDVSVKPHRMRFWEFDP